MAKRKIPSDNAFFHYYNANPKNRHTGDCVIRAISLALDKRYKEVLMDMAELSFKTGYSIGSTELEKKYLELNGWVKMKQPKWEDGTKFTGKQFCYAFPNIKTAVVSIGSHHLSCVKEGKIWDIWDCSGDKVGIYYVKK